MLNSTGMIFIFGIFNGMLYGTYHSELRRLEFPQQYQPTTTSRYEPSTAVQQISAGRSHILALADDGNVWCWKSDIGYLLWPFEVGVVGGKATRVVAGESQ